MSRRIGIDHRTDIYSLGVTLYEMLCMQRPFEGKTSHEVLKQIILVDPVDPHRTNTKVPRDLSTICLKAMEKMPDRRYRTMRELGEDLGRFLSGDVILAKPAGLATRLKKRVKRHPVASAASAVALLAIAVFALVVPWIVARKEREKKDAAVQASIEIDRQRRIVEDQLNQITKLSSLKLLRELEEDAGALWPAFPENIPAFEEWLARAKAMLARLDEFKRDLDALRAQALPYGNEARKRDEETHPDWEDLLLLRKNRDRLAAKIAAFEDARPGDGSGNGRDTLEDLARWKRELAWKEARIAELEPRVSARRTWEFEDLNKKWWHDMLVELVSGLEALTGNERCPVPSVKERLAFARTVKGRSIDDHQEAWDQAIASIGNPEECPVYGGLKIREQIGLVPIGRDPVSGFFEFAHLQTGEIPERNGDGNLVLTEETGMVFVLLPGGVFRMGAAPPSEDRPLGAPNVDPMADPYEGPVHEVAVAPFLLSKYEMTQGQWLRFRHHNPSAYFAGDSHGTTKRHPVEYVSWKDCTQRLRQFDLRLPTEAEWEYACRGGTSTVFWTGNDLQSLQGAANLRDTVFRKSESRPWRETEDWLDDGHQLHAPVGKYRPNPFGLHDMHGNVFEWCQDAFTTNYRDAPADGSAVMSYKATTRIYRGGSFFNLAQMTRCSSRSYGLYTERKENIGLRPACSLN
jgi:formylglycine-generating enzyme required for sulfatase activity